ncbi:MAG: hypothetical protein U0V70_13575 [Terriglobia bacterium]
MRLLRVVAPVAAMMHGLANGSRRWGLSFFARDGRGCGALPGGVKVVANGFRFPKELLASGIFNSGSSIGAGILAPPVVVSTVLNRDGARGVCHPGGDRLARVVIRAGLLLHTVSPGPDRKVRAHTFTEAIWEAFCLSFT